jgi:hypothetical protein
MTRVVSTWMFTKVIDLAGFFVSADFMPTGVAVINPWEIPQ